MPRSEPEHRFCYEYPKADHTVDAVVLAAGADEPGRGELDVLLVRRGLPPFEGAWALPGGFIEMDEDLPDAARRELQEETGLDVPGLEQVATFGAPGRDPRGRVISTAYVAMVDRRKRPPVPGSDAAACAWQPVDSIISGRLPVAFDHREIIAAGVRKVRLDLASRPVAATLLPREFPLAALRRVHEVILGRPLDPRAFGRDLLRAGVLRRCEEAAGARLYRFDESGPPGRGTGR